MGIFPQRCYAIYEDGKGVKNMRDLLKGHRALITGANRGIGKAILEKFAAERCDIWAHCRNESLDFAEECHDIAERYNVEIMPIYFDLRDWNVMKQKVKAIMQTKQIPDILVNNAGIMETTPFLMTTEKSLREQMEVNFMSMYVLTQSISRLMLRFHRGSIVNMASFQGEAGAAGKSAYGASKAAVRVLTESVSEELAGLGIRVNAIAPGVINTDMTRNYDEKVINNAVSMTDIGRIGQPEEIANVALFLASDLSSYMTGQVIRVDGGLKM